MYLIVSYFREKDVRITQLTAEISDQNLQAQTAIENFKKQAEENSKKIFQEMKQQVCSSVVIFPITKCTNVSVFKVVDKVNRINLM